MVLYFCGNDCLDTDCPYAGSGKDHEPLDGKSNYWNVSFSISNRNYPKYYKE